MIARLNDSWLYPKSFGLKQLNSRLTSTHEGLETFPEDNPDFSRANFEAGWSDIINGSRNEYLRKKPRTPSRTSTSLERQAV